MTFGSATFLWNWHTSSDYEKIVGSKLFVNFSPVYPDRIYKSFKKKKNFGRTSRASIKMTSPEVPLKRDNNKCVRHEMRMSKTTATQ